jgi:hypothetical protein
MPRGKHQYSRHLAGLIKGNRRRAWREQGPQSLLGAMRRGEKKWREAERAKQSPPSTGAPRAEVKQ